MGSKDFVIQELKLFKPHGRNAFSHLSYTDLLTVYNQKDTVPEIRRDGSELTIVETIKFRIQAGTELGQAQLPTGI